MFPDLRLHADIYYFTAKCNELNPTQQEEVKEAFSQVLNDEEVCVKGSIKLCNLDNFAIICGKESRRKRRSVDGVEYEEDVSEVELQVDLTSYKAFSPSKDANRICEMLRIPLRRCTKSVANAAYQRFLRSAAMYTQRQLNNLNQDPQKVSFKGTRAWILMKVLLKDHTFLYKFLNYKVS